jgi:hypothetical protein
MQAVAVQLDGLAIAAHGRAAQYSALADHAAQAPCRECAAAEAEDEDLVAALVVADEEAVRLVDVFLEPGPERAARETVEAVAGADTLIVIGDLRDGAVAFRDTRGELGQGAPFSSWSALFQVPSQQMTSLFTRWPRRSQPVRRLIEAFTASRVRTKWNARRSLERLAVAQSSVSLQSKPDSVMSESRTRALARSGDIHRAPQPENAANPNQWSVLPALVVAALLGAYAILGHRRHARAAIWSMSRTSSGRFVED